MFGKKATAWAYDTRTLLNTLFGRMSTVWPNVDNMFDITTFYPLSEDNMKKAQEITIDNYLSHCFKSKICEMHYRLNLISFEEWNNKDACNFNRFKMRTDKNK